MLAEHLRAPIRQRGWMPVAETLGAIATLALVNAVFAPARPGLLDLTPHPLLLVVLLAAGRHGLLAGLFAAGVSIVLLGGVYHSAYVVPELTMLLDEPSGIPVASLLLVAIFVGELRDVTLRKYAQVVEEHDAVMGKLERLAQAYTVLQDEKHVLEKAVLSERSPLEFLWQLVESMDTVDEKQFFATVVRLMKEVSQGQAVALYVRDERSALSLAASLGGEFPAALEALDAVTRRALDTRLVSTVADLPDASLETMAGSRLHVAVPLVREQESDAAGVVQIQQVPLATFSMVRLKALEVAGRLAARMAGRIEFYRQALVHNVLDPKIEAGTPFYLQQRGTDELARSQHRDLPLSAAVLRIPGYGQVDGRKEMMLLATLASVIRRHMRPGQLLARGAQPGVFVVLLPLETAEEAERLTLAVREEIEGYRLKPYSDGRLLSLETVAVSLYPGSETWEQAEALLESASAARRQPDG